MDQKKFSIYVGTIYLLLRLVSTITLESIFTFVLDNSKFSASIKSNIGGALLLILYMTYMYLFVILYNGSKINSNKKTIFNFIIINASIAGLICIISLFYKSWAIFFVLSIYIILEIIANLFLYYTYELLDSGAITED